ncbi:MAG: nicotinamide riboside transporter PnuC [Opitutaceae bacterium]
MLETIWSQIVATSWIEWLGTVTGIVGVYLSIKEKTAAWLLFIACYAAYVYLSYQAELFAALLMNAVFVVLSIYGWMSWTKSSKETSSSHSIRHIAKKSIAAIACFILFGAGLLGWLLDNYTEAYLPYVDAFATCCAFAAQWMLSQKYVENWLCWMIADVIYIGLWGAQGYYVSVGLFSIFIILAARGWLEWRQIVSSSEPST